jgi:hypothetical protein
MIRTCDARFRKPTLYPLSYGAGGCVQNLMHNPVHNFVWIVRLRASREFREVKVFHSASKSVGDLMSPQLLVHKVVSYETVEDLDVFRFQGPAL